MYPSQALKILPFQLIWLPQQEPPQSSLLGARVKVRMPSIFTQFPKSFQEIANLDRNVSAHSITLDHIGLYVFVWKVAASFWSSFGVLLLSLYLPFDSLLHASNFAEHHFGRIAETLAPGLQTSISLYHARSCEERLLSGKNSRGKLQDPPKLITCHIILGTHICLQKWRLRQIPRPHQAYHMSENHRIACLTNCTCSWTPRPQQQNKDEIQTTWRWHKDNIHEWRRQQDKINTKRRRNQDMIHKERHNTGKHIGSAKRKVDAKTKCRNEDNIELKSCDWSDALTFHENTYNADQNRFNCVNVCCFLLTEMHVAIHLRMLANSGGLLEAPGVETWYIKNSKIHATHTENAQRKVNANAKCRN